jgi:Trk K+ transport system NAD-binding subunit
MLDLGSLRADVPGVVGDARNPDVLAIAGLSSPQCAGVLALTDDEEANLAVTMTAAVLRPDVPVIARASDPMIQHRMREFGSPTIIDPFDRFGDHLGVALRAPTADRMVRWLTSPPGHPLPEPTPPLARGHWVLCGYGRFGRQVARDLRRDGLDVVAVDVRPHDDEPGLVVGNGTEPDVLARAGVASAGGFVAGTDNDTTNLSLIVAARRVNPRVSVVARQNVPTNHALFEAMRPDLLMVPSDVVAQDAIAHVGTPLLWQFLEQVVQHDEAWAQALLDRLVDRVGHRSPDLFRISLTPHEAPALARVGGPYPTLGSLMRDPQDRERPLAAVTLLVSRGPDVVVTPDDDLRLEPDDLLLVAGTSAAWRGLETTIQVDSAAGYVLTGRHVPAGWLWRTVSSGSGRR